MTERNKGGRPKSSDRGQKLQIRVSASELERMQAAADAAHIPLATWARARLLDAAPKFALGQHVEGGNTAEDYDHGIVDAIDGDQVTVSWRQSLVTTTQSASVLRPYGTYCPDDDG